LPQQHYFSPNKKAVEAKIEEDEKALETKFSLKKPDLIK
jgi:hypothetical protein